MTEINAKIDYNTIDYNDPDDYAPDRHTCTSCGSESDERIGYNEELDLLKRACSNCGMVYVEDDDGNKVVLKGEARDWEDYLRSHLKLPFEAIVDEASDEEIFGFGDPGPIKYRDKLIVTEVVMDDGMYGIIVDVRKGRAKHAFPLCDMKVANKNSSNYKLVDDYRTWFANCR